MMKTAFLLMFLSLNVFAGVSENIKEIEECLWTRSEKACQLIAKKQKADADYYSSALKTFDDNCESDYEKCHYYFTVSTVLGKKQESAALKKLNDLCEKNTDICIALALAYENKKDIPKALAAAKKYFDKAKKGPYIWLAYKYKTDIKAAFEASLAECRSNNENCTTYLRLMPDHPQYNEIVNLSEFACKNSKGQGVGATSCAIVGAYFYKTKNYEKAEESWASDCKNNYISCMLILGADDLRAPLRSFALKSLCDNNPSSLFRDDPEARLFVCEGKKGGKYDGEPIDVARGKARAILAEYLQAQN